MSRDIDLDPILVLARRQVGHGRLTISRASVTFDNPLCGDRIDLDVDWRDDGQISRIGHEVRGCVLCRAAASILGAGAPGRTARELSTAARDLERMLAGESDVFDGWSELAVFQSVRGHKSRYGCVLLPFNALLAALRSSKG